MESQNIYLHLKVLYVRAVVQTVESEREAAACVKYRVTAWLAQ